MGLFNFLTYRKFRTEIWAGLSAKNRLKLFQKMENIMAKKMQRPVFQVIPHAFEDNTNGLCKYATKQILLNKIFLEEDYLQFYGLATLFHEERHAYQYQEVIRQKGNPSRFSKTYKWKNDMEGYLDYDAREKYSYYSMQNIERDANKYAIYRLKKLKFWFRYDNLYYKTLDLKVQQFDEVKKIAKQELGLFYKFKIRKKQRNEARRKKR